MKKLILILSILILLVSCSSNDNKGYGYNTKSEIPEQTTQPSTNPQNSEGFFARATRLEETRSMHVYNLQGYEFKYIYAYKGNYDGHEFYVFQDGDGLCVVPVALCKYYESLLEK